MEALIIEGTESSPKVVFDPSNNAFEISGDSRPENVRKFYEPLLGWLDDYQKEINADAASVKIVFKVQFEYFNSTSAKFLLNLLTKFKEIKNAGADVKIEWNYDKPDIDMKEAGEEYAKILEIPFDFVAHDI